MRQPQHTLTKRDYHPDRLTFKAPYHCIKDDIIYSNLYNAYTLVQVPGERFFILTMKEAIPLIKDERLTQEAKTFVAQEAEHAKIHHSYNKVITNAHYAKAQQIIDDWDTFFNEWTNPKLPLQRKLLFVVLAELFTAHIAEDFFDRWHNQWQRLDNNIALLFSFHNAEEIEHKSLCFDVYQSIYGHPANDPSNLPAWHQFKEKMIQNIIHATTYFTACDALLNKQPIPRRQQIQDYLSQPDGIFPNGKFCEEFDNPNFHPWDNDTSGWIQIWEKEWVPNLE
jgi:uncharacterized protein